MNTYEMYQQLMSSSTVNNDHESQCGIMVTQWYENRRNIEVLEQRMKEYAQDLHRTATVMLREMAAGVHTSGSWAMKYARDFEECEQRRKERYERSNFLENYLAKFVDGAKEMFKQERKERTELAETYWQQQ